MAQFGAKVAIWERDPQTCAATAADLGALGIVTDVREAEQVDAALARTTAELGPVSILVNNAGGVFASRCSTPPRTVGMRCTGPTFGTCCCAPNGSRDNSSPTGAAAA